MRGGRDEAMLDLWCNHLTGLNWHWATAYSPTRYACQAYASRVKKTGKAASRQNAPSWPQLSTPWRIYGNTARRFTGQLQPTSILLTIIYQRRPQTLTAYKSNNAALNSTPTPLNRFSVKWSTVKRSNFAISLTLHRNANAELRFHQWWPQLWKFTRSRQGPENVCQVLGSKEKFEN